MTDCYTPDNVKRLSEGRLGEVEQGVNIADAAKKCNVELFIHSSLHDAETISNGRDKVVHFSAKNMVAVYARNIGLNSIAVELGVFMQNFATGLFPKIDVLSTGTIEWQLPLRNDVGLPLIDIDQFGKYMVKILENPDRWVGKTLVLAGEYLTLDQAAIVYTEVTGQKCVFRRLTMEEYAKQNENFPFLEEWSQMWDYFNEMGYFNGESLVPINSTLCETHTFRDWLKASGWRIDIDKERAKKREKQPEKSPAEKQFVSQIYHYAKQSKRVLCNNSPSLKDKLKLLL